MQLLPLGVLIGLSVRGERLPHVLIALIFLVNKMIGRSDVIVSVSFHTTDSILVFELVVIDQPVEKIRHPRHLLKAWK